MPKFIAIHFHCCGPFISSLPYAAQPIHTFPTPSTQPHLNHAIPSVSAAAPLPTAPSQSMPFGVAPPTFASVTAPRPGEITHLQHNPNPNLQKPSNDAWLRYKLGALWTAREKGNPVCYRRGDSGHLAHSCRNSLVCFACGRLGHHSSNCQSITMVSSTSTPLSFASIEEAAKLPPIIVTSNPINSEFRATLRNSLVLKDVQGVGAIFIQSHLSQTFPISGWNWMVRALPDNKFLVEPPSEEWKRKALFNGQIWLGGICFPIELFHPFKNDGGRDPLKVWVQILGLPQYLWKDFELRRIAKEFGGFIKVREHHDYNVNK
jgi:Domain of unknown function (DUF4283)/Zinc knuckle